MAYVNPTINTPHAPGFWVDEESCVCGAEYKKFRCWPSFADAADRIRLAAGGFEQSNGGFRSRRVVLWVMHVIKLSEWYTEHEGCRGLAEEFEAAGAQIAQAYGESDPPPAICVQDEW